MLPSEHNLCPLPVVFTLVTFCFVKVVPPGISLSRAHHSPFPSGPGFTATQRTWTVLWGCSQWKPSRGGSCWCWGDRAAVCYRSRAGSSFVVHKGGFTILHAHSFPASPWAPNALSSCCRDSRSWPFCLPFLQGLTDFLCPRLEWFNVNTQRRSSREQGFLLLWLWSDFLSDLSTALCIWEEEYSCSGVADFLSSLHSPFQSHPPFFLRKSLWRLCCRLLFLHRASNLIKPLTGRGWKDNFPPASC